MAADVNGSCNWEMTSCLWLDGAITEVDPDRYDARPNTRKTLGQTCRARVYKALNPCVRACVRVTGQYVKVE